MTVPAFIFGMLISTLYGAAFHLFRGGGLGRLILYILLGWIGFWAGHALADKFDWTFASLGPLHLGTATIFCFLFLLIGNWLSLVEGERD
jgi:uncharacterized membrane protein YeaQ/YmgE (transglycosylase-associated protein family)